jgi:hypothetical protein
VSAWLNFAGLIIAAAISGYAAFMASRAEKNSRPVSNGFTGYVLDDLRDIKKSLYEHLLTHGEVNPKSPREQEPDCA